MLVPIFKTILPKTLLKWTTPQSKLATKFKTKYTTTPTAAINVKTTLTLICPTAFKTATTIAKLKHINTASSPSSSFKAFYISILIVAKLFLHTVINNLSSLMNDFRTKLRYLTAATTSNTTLFSNLASSSTSSSTATTTIDTKLFNNNYKNNHRTYNNSSKSNKVFLYYTPRDPRLRIFYQPQQQQQQLSLDTLNKHLVSLESDSELKITEDLCNYGELIGGLSGIKNKTNNSSEWWFNCVLKNKNNNNKKIIVNCCDLKKISVDESGNNTHVNSEKRDKTSQKNTKKLLPEQQQQDQEKVFVVQPLHKSSVQGHRMNHNCSIAIKGFFTAVVRF